MQLVECDIKNFGTLSDFKCRLSPGLNQIKCDNGWGKSTLAAFIKVMLYGFDDERRRTGLSERKKYEPWQGGEYGGRLTFSTDKGIFEACMTFGKNERDDRFVLIDAKTGLESDAYGRNPGAEILGMDRDSFFNTLYISQEKHESHATDGIHAKVADGESVIDDISDYQKIEKRIRDELNHASPVRKGGKLRRESERLSYVEQELRKLDACKKNRSRFVIEQAALMEEEKNLKDSIKRAEEQKLRISETERLKLKRSRYDELKQEADERKKVFDELADKAKETKERNGILADLLIAAVCLFMFAEAFVQGKTSTALSLSLAVCAFLCGTCLAVRMQRIRIMQRVSGEILQALKTAGDEYEKAAKRLVKFERLEEKDLKLYEDLCKAPDACTPEEANARALLCNEKLKGISQRISQVTRELECIDDDIDRQEELAADYSRDLERYKTACQKYEALKLAGEFMEKARINIINQYTAPFYDSLKKYYCSLTGKEICPLHVDARLDVSLDVSSMFRELECQSAGYRDVIWLAMRLSFIEAMYPEESVFIIMDDPFVNLDDDRLAAAFRVLEDAASSHQIIYFACHESRKIPGCGSVL